MKTLTIKAGGRAFTLTPLKGKQGRLDTIRILNAFRDMGDMETFTEQTWEQVEAILPILFCCTPEELEALSFSEIMAAIPHAMQFHIGSLETEEVRAATKNSRRGRRSAG